MCVSCILQVSRAYTFRKKYRSSNETLQSLLNNTEVADVNRNDKENSTCKVDDVCEQFKSNVVLAANLISVPSMEPEDDIPVDMKQPSQSRLIALEHDTDELITLQEIEHAFTDSILDKLTTEVETLELSLPFQCSLCSTEFSSNDELQSHNELAHTTSAISSKQNAASSFQPISDINENVRHYKFECPECHKRFAENKIL